MKIFVTGSEGFIGSHLVEYLVKKKHSVTALVQYNSLGKKGWLEDLNKFTKKKIKICFGDIKDQRLLIQQSKNHDCIIHLAALISIPYSYEAPKSYIDTNIMGTYNILEATKLNKIKKLIVTSTSEIYGRSKIFPINEENQVDPRSPYSATKIAADQLSLSYFYSFQLPVTIIRPFNTFGPRQSQRAVIPTIINQVLANKKHINLGNLNTKRNFNYIDDIVRGFELATNLNKRTNGKIINLGSKFEISIKQLADLILMIKNKKIPIKSIDARVRPSNSEVIRLIANNRKAKSLINWSPNIDNKKKFIVSLKKTIHWFAKNHEHYSNQSDDYMI